jgi:hypothetical protein
MRRFTGMTLPVVNLVYGFATCPLSRPPRTGDTRTHARGPSVTSASQPWTTLSF